MKLRMRFTIPRFLVFLLMLASSVGLVWTYRYYRPSFKALLYACKMQYPPTGSGSGVRYLSNDGVTVWVSRYGFPNREDAKSAYEREKALGGEVTETGVVSPASDDVSAKRFTTNLVLNGERTVMVVQRVDRQVVIYKSPSLRHILRLEQLLRSSSIFDRGSLR